MKKLQHEVSLKFAQEKRSLFFSVYFQEFFFVADLHSGFFSALIEIIYIKHGNPDEVGPCTVCLSYKGVKGESPLGERSQYVWHEMLKGQPSALQKQRPCL